MAFTHKDLLDLNHVEMAGAPIVTSVSDIENLYQRGATMSVAGMRHSQGGHTALAGGDMLITETMNREIEFGPNKDSGLPGKTPLEWVKVDAGMTWAELHYHLECRDAAPLVHQSSAHFTIGGSLSVNCHGRETAIGAVSGTVMSIDVLTGNGVRITASPTSNFELFRAVIGGYGACGVILKAQIRVAQNVPAYRFGYEISFADYETLLDRMKAPLIPKFKLHPEWRLSSKPLPIGDDASIPFDNDDALLMHHGWVNVSQKDYLKTMIGYDTYQSDRWPVDSSTPDPLKHETWGASELLRAGWVAAQEDPEMRNQLWRELKRRTMASNGIWSRLDYMREAITFTSSSGKRPYDSNGAPLSRNGVAMLQEYFVPIDKFAEFMAGYEAAFLYNGLQSSPTVQLLSTTTRYVKGDAGQPYLSYAPDGEPRISIALEAYVPFKQDGKTPTNEAAKQFRDAIEAALACRGSYYLPYYKFADYGQFNRAYASHPNFTLLKTAITHHNPNHRFSNQFLADYCIH